MVPTSTLQHNEKDVVKSALTRESIYEAMHSTIQWAAMTDIQQVVNEARVDALLCGMKIEPMFPHSRETTFGALFPTVQNNQG